MKGVHVDHHALWINPKDPRHLILGNDGGLYFSKNRARSWQHIRGMALGQFYALGLDMSKPYRVYGGLQDNGSWGGPSATRAAEGITLADWRKVGKGDGFYCQVDPTNPNTLYAEKQYGKSWRIDLKAGTTKTISPKAGKGESIRWNWSTPMLLSPHSPKTLFCAGNYLFRSDNRGDTWQRISPDLTRGQPNQKSTGHTISTIAESPRKAGLLWAGTDDGKLHVTRNGGKTWADLSDKVPGVPPDRWITRVECSHFEEGTAYLTIGRHRNDDRRPYLFKTTDHGNTWKPLVSNLPPDGPLHVVRESSRNRDLLFVGTEQALFVSRDGGARWQRVPGLPPVPVHDLVIHPRDRDLVIGTHGRSVWVMDVAPLEQLTGKALTAEAHLFEVRPALAFEPRKSEAPPAKAFVGSNPPFGATIYYHLRNAVAGPVSVTILDGSGKTVATLAGSNQAGLHRVVWDLRRAGAGPGLVAPGEYVARLQAGPVPLTRPVRVEAGE
ncbi:MAG: hypothetical protein L0Z62_22945 [Gemmataceae bacterium]|nr:hypothetical protein [Gemmataceae bacterium]